jgi:hypothetical protein
MLAAASRKLKEFDDARRYDEMAKSYVGKEEA